MMHVTTDQLLNVWMQLEDALNDPEYVDIEMYRVWVQRYEMVRVGEAVEDAERTLMKIYELFAAKRDANIYVVVNNHHTHVIRVSLSKGPAGKVTIIGDER